MQKFNNPDRKIWAEILKRPQMDTAALFSLVGDILKDIRKRGDAALKEYTGKYDGVDLDSFIVSPEEMKAGVNKVSDELKKAIDRAAVNIEKFHAAQKMETVKIETEPGIVCWQKQVPIEKVGLYVPGGSAPLFSTTLMLGIPAKIAGCKEIILCSPPNKNGKIHPAVLYAAKLAGIDKIYKLGGVQAIGAMAYGTESVPKTFKIFGPGNQYVTAAKQLVSIEETAIDMPAGPSEVAVMADETAIPEFVASDLLSQAEHGGDSQVILVSSSEKLIRETEEALNEQLAELPRKAQAEKAIQNSLMIQMENEDEMLELINFYAPEHLIISLKNYREVSEKIVNAGSVFLGNYTPESAGDYASGTNHTLPTYGFARVYSGVNLDAYTKKITYQEISREGLQNIGETLETLAQNEGLYAHKNAVSLRLKKK